MGILPLDRPGGKPGVSERPDRATQADPVEVTLFRALVECVNARQYRQASEIRRELYRRGWSVIPRATWGKGVAE